MPGRILVAGLDARELRLEVRFLQRDPELVTEALSARELFDAVAREEASLVVLGPRLPDIPIEEAIRRIREGPEGQRASILVLVPASDLAGTEGLVLGAGANAALRRPLERFVLESWVAKLLDVPRRVLTRIPVHVQVVGSRKSAPGEHFYGLSRNLSVHGMLLASPVRIEAEDLDLEIDLPEAEGRIRVLGRIAREAPEVGWPYMGYGIEFLFLPEAGQRAIDRMVKRETPPEPAKSLWAPDAIHSTLRRDEWIYEVTEPARTDSGFLVEVRRAARDGGAPGRRAPSTSCRGTRRVSPSTPPASSCAATADHLPRVSVLLPVRDAATTLHACLDSLAAQTLGDHEIVAVDDGSGDGSGELLLARAGSDPRLRVLRTPRRGLVGALSLALAQARAPLVARMDADDVARTPRLALQAERLERDTAVDVLGCRVALAPRRASPPGRGCASTWSGRTRSSIMARWRATDSSSRPSSTPRWP